MILAFDDFELDDARFELRRGGARIAVQPKPLDLLLYLARNRHRIVTKQEIFDELWKGVVVSEAALSRVVMEARKAVGDQGAAEIVQTSRGRGFRFAAAIRELSGERGGGRAGATATAGAGAAAGVAYSTSAPVAAEDAQETAESTVFVDRAAGSVGRDEAASRAGAPRVARAERTLALLPLRNLGGPEDAWIADGLTEDLIDTLCMIDGLKVRARGVVWPYRDTQEDPRDVGRKIGVMVVAEGSVQRAGDDVRVRARLVNVADGYQLWAQRFDCKMAQVLGAGDGAARAIAAALEGKHAAPERSAPDDALAIELYLRSNRQMASDFTAGGEAEAWLREARERAPSDPRILSRYAIWRVRDAYREGRTGASVADARDAAERALAVGSHLGEPWVAMANVLHNSDETPEAMRALRRAIRNAPSLATAHELLGRILVEVDCVEAIPCLERTLWLDPALHFATVDLARAHALTGAWAVAEDTLAPLFEKSPVHHAILSARLALWRGKPAARTSMLPEAVEPLVARFNELWTRLVVDRRLTESDRGFLAALGRGQAASSRPQRLFGQLRAEVLAHVGDLAAARQALDDSVKGGLIDLSWLKLCPVIAPLRATPGFAELLASVESRAATVMSAFLDDAVAA